MINDHSKQIGLNVTPHDLRHFYVSRAIEVGMTVKEVSELAGHSKPCCIHILQKGNLKINKIVCNQ